MADPYSGPPHCYLVIYRFNLTYMIISEKNRVQNYLTILSLKLCDVFE